MNDKLKEIATQAKVEHCISHVRLQEFAELIISECIDAVKQQENVNHAVTTYDRDIAEATAQRCIRSIKARFE